MNPRFNAESYQLQRGAFSRKRAAAYIDCSIRKLDKLAEEGELRRAKIGSKTIYLKTELDRFLQSKMEG